MQNSVAQAQNNSPPEVQIAAKWLRNKSGMKTRTGVFNGKRAEYVKAKTLHKTLLSPAFAALKGTPKVTSTEEAREFHQKLIQGGFLFLCNRSSSGTSGVKALQLVAQQSVQEEGYYVWLLDPDPFWALVIAGAAVVVVLALVMFPLWPLKMRIGVWYLSMAVLGLIGAFFGLAVVRLIFYVITYVAAKPGIWIFPNLFADCGFVDSFIPGWEWDIPPPKKVKKSKKSKEGKEKKSKNADAGHQGHVHGPGCSHDQQTIISTPSGGAKIVELVDDSDEEEEY